MIRPEGFRGAAFGTLAEGDARIDAAVRGQMARQLGIPSEWAFLTQVHGTTVIEVDSPGPQGEGDAMFTTSAVPIAVGTADCVPLILEGPGIVAVIHAGWRGAAAGVVAATLDTLRSRGFEITRAAIGPAIGPGCYEVGDDVANQFPEFSSITGWGTRSIDLAAAVGAQLDGIPTWQSEACTFSDERFASYRRNRTDLRQVAVAWLPND